MTLKNIAVLLALSFSLAACAVVDVTKTAKGFHERTDPNEIQILKTRPLRTYEELGTVTATLFMPSETAKMHNAIRAKSAVLGADAVYLTEEGILNNGRKWATGVAIHFTN